MMVLLSNQEESQKFVDCDAAQFNLGYLERDK